MDMDISGIFQLLSANWCHMMIQIGHIGISNPDPVRYKIENKYLGQMGQARGPIQSGVPLKCV